MEQCVLVYYLLSIHIFFNLMLILQKLTVVFVITVYLLSCISDKFVFHEVRTRFLMVGVHLNIFQSKMVNI